MTEHLENVGEGTGLEREGAITIQTQEPGLGTALTLLHAFNPSNLEGRGRQIFVSSRRNWSTQ